MKVISRTNFLLATLQCIELHFASTVHLLAVQLPFIYCTSTVNLLCIKEGKVFYGQEPLSGESTTTECGVNYQLLAVITEVAELGTPSCSRSQQATDNGV